MRPAGGRRASDGRTAADSGKTVVTVGWLARSDELRAVGPTRFDEPLLSSTGPTAATGESLVHTCLARGFRCAMTPSRRGAHEDAATAMSEVAEETMSGNLVKGGRHAEGQHRCATPS